MTKRPCLLRPCPQPLRSGCPPRPALKAAEMAGTSIPKGAHVTIGQCASRRNPRFFAVPDEFSPEGDSMTLRSGYPGGLTSPSQREPGKLGRPPCAPGSTHHPAEDGEEQTAPLPAPKPRATFRPKSGVPSVMVGFGLEIFRTRRNTVKPPPDVHTTHSIPLTAPDIIRRRGTGFGPRAGYSF